MVVVTLANNPPNNPLLNSVQKSLKRAFNLSQIFVTTPFKSSKKSLNLKFVLCCSINLGIESLIQTKALQIQSLAFALLPFSTQC